MTRFIFSVFGAIFSVLTMGTLMVALTIGAVFWMYGRDLPSHEHLAQYTPPTISRIYSTEGQVIDEFAQERRLFTPAEEIPDLIKHAFVSAEDKNFYSHQGYDVRGIASAAVEAVQSRGGSVRGASTITQQVMKNFLLSGDRKMERKIKEIILATRVEEALSKEKILELYLNEIFLGQNAYGVTAAAQVYFNKTLVELAPHEAAFLASLPKAPSSFHPVRRKERVTNRRNFVLKEMYENNYITYETYQSERLLPLLSVQNGDYEPYGRSLPPRDYFTDEIRRQLSRNFGEDQFFSGGYSVRATLDPEMQVEAAQSLQRALEQYDRGLGRWNGTGKKIEPDQLGSEATWREALSNTRVARDVDLDSEWLPAVVLDVRENELQVGIEGIDQNDPRGNTIPRSDTSWFKGNLFDNFERGDVIHLREMRDDGNGNFIRWTLRQVPKVQGGFMAMDVNTGRVIAMQGGFSYQNSVFNRATQAQRQPGSSFKPFVYAAALDSGYTPATIVVDAPIEIDTPYGVWRPKNASNKFYGPTPLRTGIEQSRNLMTIRLAQEVGMDVVASYAEKFGMYDSMGRVLANALGADETTLYQVVAAYAMFANGGERVQPTLIDRVQDRYGTTIFSHDAAPGNKRVCVDCDDPNIRSGRSPRIVNDRERVMDPVTAYQLTSMMQGVVERGTARKTVKVGVPTAGKTGTTNDAKDVWFVGFTSNIVAGCYIGYDTPKPMGRGASGGGMCGPVFTRFMRKATKKYGGGAFRAPEECEFIKIDRFSGARLGESASGPNVVSECFREFDIDSGAIVFGGQGITGSFAVSGSFDLIRPNDAAGKAREVTTSTGKKAVVGPKAGFGTLSSGGLF
ncbi:PBP1A family penicillin-binding protein [uncultured Pelagimonas sp.]|uniref:penicillin-binding protein 1A n=1 Tax=uncultured Pelagimonas sp. TaxID=1618102 RepID=UPI00261CA686|nr:PBP1A family penicillin-binding protein [uncultured Pelagimonas sp.]